MISTAIKFRKVNDDPNYVATPGEAIAVVILNDTDTAPIVEHVETGTSYTPQLTDANKSIRTTSGSAVTITVAPDSSLNFPTNTLISLTQYGAGALSVAEGAGVTVNSLGGSLTLAGQYAAATLQKIGPNEWLLVGALA